MPNPSERCADGSAMFTIKTSSEIMSCARQSVARTQPRRSLSTARTPAVAVDVAAGNLGRSVC
jgi:hypothetical protein